MKYVKQAQYYPHNLVDNVVTKEDIYRQSIIYIVKAMPIKDLNKLFHMTEKLDRVPYFNDYKELITMTTTITLPE